MRWLTFATLVLLCGCSGDSVASPDEHVDPPSPAPYAVTGSIIDDGGQGVPGVLVDFGSFGTATTALDGTWSKSGLEGLVTITPSKENWGFTPGSIDVESAASGVEFTAASITTLLEVVVQWDDIGTAVPASSSVSLLASQAASHVEPTHFGTRLEYPDDNAFFAQALTRDQVEEYGLITLEVPPAENTALFVTAVHLGDGGEGQAGQRDPIVWLGQVRDLEIVEGAATTVQMEDVEWTVPLWEFEGDEVEVAYESGAMTGDMDTPHLEFFITVRDPFEDRPWDDFIGLNGTGGAVGESIDGLWRVRVQCRNELVGQEHDSTCRFWPYLHSERFNVPDVRFSVPPITKDFVVEWR